MDLLHDGIIKHTNRLGKQQPNPVLDISGKVLPNSDSMAESIYICLGSNWPDAPVRLAKARKAIEGLPGIEVWGVSHIYFTEPQGYASQAWFHNQVMELRSGSWEPRELMQRFLEIESELGRIRNANRFGPRAIDIDLLLFGARNSDDPFCTLPHPRLAERAFALVPLLELAPEIMLGDTKAADLLAGLSWRMQGRKIFQTSADCGAYDD